MTDAQTLAATARSLEGADSSRLSSAAEGFSGAAPAALVEALGTLSPAHHSTGYLLLLDVLRQGLAQPSESYIAATCALLAGGVGSALRTMPDRLAAVCRALKEGCIACGAPKRAIAPLQAAVRLAQPSESHLTPQHADLFQVCLASKCYAAASAVLANDVLVVSPEATGVTARDFLLWCYYGGMLCAGLRRYEQAMELLLSAVTAPAVALNAIVVAAYKKYVLVSLVSAGAVPALPKFTSSVVQRHLKSCCAEYGELAAAYATRSPDELLKAVGAHHELLARDVNLGLAKQVVRSLYTRNIQRLTQTYLTLSLEDIASAVGLAGAREAERHVLQMLEAGEIFATIDQRDGMVSFREDPERYDTRATSAAIVREIEQVTGLAGKVQAMDEEVQCDRGYVMKCLASGRPSLATTAAAATAAAAGADPAAAGPAGV